VKERASLADRFGAGGGTKVGECGDWEEEKSGAPKCATLCGREFFGGPYCTSSKIAKVFWLLSISIPITFVESTT